MLAEGVTFEHAHSSHAEFIAARVKDGKVTGVQFVVNDHSLIQVRKCLDFISEVLDSFLFIGVITYPIFIQVVEAPTKVLLDLLQQLSSPSLDDRLFSIAKVCCLNEEVLREFPVWASREIRQSNADFEHPTSWVKVESHVLYLIIPISRRVIFSRKFLSHEPIFLCSQFSRHCVVSSSWVVSSL